VIINLLMFVIPFFAFSLRCGYPADLESFWESLHGFLEEARIRGIPSPPFGGLGQSSYLETR